MLERFFKKKPSSSEKLESIVKKSVRKGAKNILTGNDSLTIDGRHNLIKEEINKTARSIIKEAIEKPEVLMNFVKANGTIIVKSKYMSKILFLFGETEGFLTPMVGIKAFLFSLLLKIFAKTAPGVGFSTPAMFALKDEPVNIYTMAHQFHLWLSYINNLPGFEQKTRNHFKDFWKVGPDSKEVSYLSVDDIFGLKDMIARELEALNFVKEIGREFMGQKKSVKKLQEGGSVNL